MPRLEGKQSNAFASLITYYPIFRKRSKGRVEYFLILSFAASILEALGVIALFPLLGLIGLGEKNDFQNNQLSDFILNVFDFLNIPLSLISILIAFLFIILLKNSILFLATIIRAWMRASISRDLKLDLFDSLTNVKMGFFYSENVGYFSSIIGIHADRYVKAFVQYVSLLGAFLSIFAYGLGAFLIDWKATFFAIIVGGFVAVGQKFANRYSHEKSIIHASMTNVFLQELVQILESFKYIKATNTTSVIKKKTIEAVSGIESLTFKLGVVNAILKCLREPILVTGIIGYIFVWTYLFGNSLVTIFVSLLFFYRLLNSLLSFQVNLTSFISSVGSIELINGDIHRFQNSKERSGKVNIEGLSKSIDFQNVSFKYSNSKEISIKNASFSIPKNKITALTGASGSGKTTLVDLMAGLIEPTSGKILIDGADLKDINLHSWRQNIGYVSQDLIIFDDTIFNNVRMFGNLTLTKDEGRKRVIETLNLVGLYSSFDEASKKLDTVVGDRGAKLSGGQRQRLFLARELYRKPNLLLVDEGTSALDAKTEKIVLKTLTQLSKSTTIVFIAHKDSSLKIADIIYDVENGAIRQR